jgi:hypothetical protein
MKKLLNLETLGLKKKMKEEKMKKMLNLEILGEKNKR